MFLVQAVSSIHCFYCLNCTAQDKRTLQKCSYKFTHCAAVQVVLRSKLGPLSLLHWPVLTNSFTRRAKGIPVCVRTVNDLHKTLYYRVL